MTLKEAEALIYKYQGVEILARGVDEVREGHERKVSWYTKRFIDVLPLSKSAKIIDLPCGDGNILYFLQKAGYTNVKGFDLDESRVLMAQKLGLNASVEDAFTAVKSITDCDVIFSVDFFEHVDRSSAFELLSACQDALKVGGYLIIRTPVTDSVFGTLHLHNDFTHRWAVNSSVWRAIAGSLGFKLVSIMDERPVGHDFKNLVRRALFELARVPTILHRRMLGHSAPKVWSPSAWFILKKDDAKI
ncbi:class I SAM-dependent methyltransferase [Coraliomargarita sp. W4R53]